SVPWTDSWNLSLQRSVTKDTVFEVRYQGNRGYGAWTTENWNATNVQETGWYDTKTGAGEFKQAQANLRANVNAGRGPSVAYMGPGTGTVPLPILYAHFTGRTDYTNSANYNTSIWTSPSLTPLLDEYFPSPNSFASTLYGTAFSSTSLPAGTSTRLFQN